MRMTLLAIGILLGAVPVPSVRAAATNLVVNFAPATGALHGYKHACQVPGKIPWKSFPLTVAEDGSLTIDNTQAPNMTMGVVEIDVASLEAGAEYLCSLEIRADRSTSIILNLPSPSPDGAADPKGNPKAKSEWARVGTDWKTLSASFVFDPSLNKEGVSLFMNAQNAADIFHIRNVRVSPHTP